MEDIPLSPERLMTIRQPELDLGFRKV